jgi:hypothetical protein
MAGGTATVKADRRGAACRTRPVAFRSDPGQGNKEKRPASRRSRPESLKHPAQKRQTSQRGTAGTNSTPGGDAEPVPNNRELNIEQTLPFRNAALVGSVMRWQHDLLLEFVTIARRPRVARMRSRREARCCRIFRQHLPVIQYVQRCDFWIRKSRKTCTRATDFISSG